MTSRGLECSQECIIGHLIFNQLAKKKSFQKLCKTYGQFNSNVNLRIFVENVYFPIKLLIIINNYE